MAEAELLLLIANIQRNTRSIHQHRQSGDWRQSDTIAKTMTEQFHRLQQLVSGISTPSDELQQALIALERDIRRTSAQLQQQLSGHQQAMLRIERHQRALEWLQAEMLA